MFMLLQSNSPVILEEIKGDLKREFDIEFNVIEIEKGEVFGLIIVSAMFYGMLKDFITYNEIYIYLKENYINANDGWKEYPDLVNSDIWFYKDNLPHLDMEQLKCQISRLPPSRTMPSPDSKPSMPTKKSGLLPFMKNAYARWRTWRAEPLSN
jgi:hypothetical protein